MEKVKKLFGMVSYEGLIFCVLMFQFITGRALDLDGWSSAWHVMDYSMGFGSRLLIGSIYRLFNGDGFFDYTTAYKYVAIGIMFTILILSIVLGRLIRMGLKSAPAAKNAIWGTVAAYVVAPYSIAYVWNEQNLGRLDVYMLLMALLCLMAALTIKNVYVKIILFTVLSAVGIAIHQGFAFLYYPLVFTVMCYEVFSENRVHVKYFIAAVISGLVDVAVAVYFQFFSYVNFSSPAEMAGFLETKTNLEIVEWALELEYFQGMSYQLNNITRYFFAEEHPVLRLTLISLLMAPVLGLYILIWKDVFCHLKANQVKVLQTPYFYAMLSNLCFVPMFLIHTDWGRHIAPLMAMPSFVFLFFLARKDASMQYAYKRMEQRVKKYPWYFVLTLLWIAGMESFGARIFQGQADMILEVVRYGFHR